MNEHDNQNENIQTQKNTERYKNFATASLILGILSIVISIFFPFVLSVLAIIFGAVSINNVKNSRAVAGIVTGSAGLFLQIIIVALLIIFSLASNYSKPDDNTFTSVTEASDGYWDESEITGQNISLDTFYGEVFELTYNSDLWHTDVFFNNSEANTADSLIYVPDDSIFVVDSIYDMEGLSTATKTDRDYIYDSNLKAFKEFDNTDVYIQGASNRLILLNNDIYYASYNFHLSENDELYCVVYMVFSELHNLQIMFYYAVEDETKYNPDDTIVPLLKTIVITDTIEQQDYSYENGIYSDEGFEITYNKSLWYSNIYTSGSGVETPLIQYSLDESIFVKNGISSMMGYSTATKAERDELHNVFFDTYTKSVDSKWGEYVLSGTDTLKVFNNDLYYSSFHFYKIDESEPYYAVYLIFSEKDDKILSFDFYTEFISKYDPDTVVLSLLETITIVETDSFESTEYSAQNVWEYSDEYVVFNESIPSLSKFMTNENITYTYVKSDKTGGKMRVHTIADYWVEPDWYSVEMLEIIFNDVSDVYGAINALGGTLYREYGFSATFSPTQYPNYGEDYLFCELIKELDNGNGIFYVAAVYSNEENIIILQVGNISFPGVPLDGIGPINLEKLEQIGIAA